MSSSLAAIALHELPIAVVDFETTGLNAALDRVVQLGIVHSHGAAPPNLVLNSLVNPQCAIDPRATAVHGITDRHVANAPTFAQTVAHIVPALEGRVIAGYNSAFDLKFLRAELRRVGLGFDTPFICVMELRQMIFAERRCRLIDACREVGIPLDNAHDASADAWATSILLRQYFELLRQARVYTLQDLSNGYGHRAFVSSFRCPGFFISTSPVIEAVRQPTTKSASALEHHCERLNREAATKVERLETLLVSGLKHDVRVRWDRLMTSLVFDEPVPARPAYVAPEKPNLTLKPDLTKKPTPDDPKYAVDDVGLHSLVPWLKEKKQQERQNQYRADVYAFNQRIARWNQLVADYQSQVEQAKRAYEHHVRMYEEADQQYQARRSQFLEQAAIHNAQIERERAAYEKGVPEGVARAMTRVLMNSELTEEFPDEVDVVFDAEQRQLAVVRALPAFDDMPVVKSYRVLKKEGDLKEQLLTDAARKRLYDGVVHQLALRTAYEVFKGDTARAIQSIDVRCVVDGYDPATGHPGRLVLALLRVRRDNLTSLRLDNVAPEVCFKSLGGKINGRPANLKPIEVLPDLKP
jgi:DNA polymerase III epsilon subunit-like protein